MSAELLLGALLAAVAVVFVALPFLRDSEPADTSVPSDAGLAAAEERDRVLAELKELEFDHRTGKISDDDYRAAVGPLRRRAVDGMLPDPTPKSPSEQHFPAESVPSDRSRR